MKLLHTSDWHIGMTVGQRNYEEDQRFFLSQLYRIIQQEQVGAVLLCGDVYDSGLVSADAIQVYNEAATTICMQLGAALIVIAGNHDSAPRLASCRDLLRPSGLYVTGRLERDVQPVLLDGGRVAVYPLPFFVRDEAAALLPEEDVSSQEAAMQAVCSRIRSGMDKSRVNIVMAHALVVNAELSDSDRSARIGTAQAVSADVFDGFDYAALGHIHKPQSIRPRVRYSGSPVKYSFGSEEKHVKSVTIFDTDTGEVRIVPLDLLHDRVSAEGTLEELIARTDLRDCYLRLHVTDRYRGLELFSMLQEHFPHLLELSGMEQEQSESYAALSVDEMDEMDECDLMEKFLQEVWQYTPGEKQTGMFRDALEKADREASEG